MAIRLEFITKGKVKIDPETYEILITNAGYTEFLEDILEDYEGATIVISREVETEDEVLAKGFNETVQAEDPRFLKVLEEA